MNVCDFFENLVRILTFLKDKNQTKKSEMGVVN